MINNLIIIISYCTSLIFAIVVLHKSIELFKASEKYLKIFYLNQEISEEEKQKKIRHREAHVTSVAYIFTSIILIWITLFYHTFFDLLIIHSDLDLLIEVMFNVGLVTMFKAIHLYIGHLIDEEGGPFAY
jgi:hypothetical protein